MKITELIWLEEIIEKLGRKHGVEPQEVREVLAHPTEYRFIEKGHRRGENVYAAFGQTDAGRYLVVFFVYKKDKRALILSAREMTHTERKRHGKK